MSAQEPIGYVIFDRTDPGWFSTIHRTSDHAELVIEQLRRLPGHDDRFGIAAIVPIEVLS